MSWGETPRRATRLANPSRSWFELPFFEYAHDDHTAQP